MFKENYNYECRNTVNNSHTYWYSVNTINLYEKKINQRQIMGWQDDEYENYGLVGQQNLQLYGQTPEFGEALVSC
jgi:hypothetical protein